MSLHVVQLGPIPPPEGGISHNILAIREELLKRGDRCSVVATSKSTSKIDDPDFHYPGTPARLLKHLATLDFDILHLHGGGDLSRRVMMLAAACAMLGRGRSVLTVHSGEYPKTDAAKSAKRNSLAGRVFRGFSRLIAVNEELANVYQRFGVPADRIEVITPFAPQLPDPTTTIPTELESFRKRHSPLLVWVGGMERDYDPLTAIDAFGKVHDEHPGVGLMMIGDGSMHDEVRDAVAKTEHSERVCLAGNVEHAVTLRLMQDANAVLRTTLFDGDAISVREALFLGTPVIATNTGARPDGVHLVKIGDAQDLSAKIKEVLSEAPASPTVSAPDNSNIISVLEIYDSLSRHVRR